MKPVHYKILTDYIIIIIIVIIIIIIIISIAHIESIGGFVHRFSLRRSAYFYLDVDSNVFG